MRDSKSIQIFKKRRRRQLIKATKGTCFYCGLQYPSRILTLDHVKPVSKGGLHSKANTVLACKNCNQAKGDMDITKADRGLVAIRRILRFGY